MKRVWLFLLVLVVFVGLVGCPEGILDTNSNNGGGLEITLQNLLRVIESDRDYYDHPSSIVDLQFPEADEIGATYYTLQFSTDGTSWADWENSEGPVTTDYNNFSIPVDQSYYFRLKISGGLFDNQYSNEELVTRSTMDTWFQGFSYTYSSPLGGSMEVGDTLETSFTLKQLDYPTYTTVDDGLTYQWYRLNPTDFSEKTVIEGAISTNYTIQDADIDKILLIRASETPSEGKVGGFMQLYFLEVVE